MSNQILQTKVSFNKNQNEELFRELDDENKLKLELNEIKDTSFNKTFINNNTIRTLSNKINQSQINESPDKKMDLNNRKEMKRNSSLKSFIFSPKNLYILKFSDKYNSKC